MTARIAPAVFGFGSRPLGRLVLPDGHTTRVSLAWWATGLDDPTPLFAQEGERPYTFVAWWGTGPDGELEPAGVDRVQTVRWDLDAALFVELEALHQEFPLGRHDVLFTEGGRVAPCRQSLLRRARHTRAPLAEQIFKQVRQLVAGGC